LGTELPENSVIQYDRKELKMRLKLGL